MKTTTYNPSPLEAEFAKSIENNREELSKNLEGRVITRIEYIIDTDNPTVEVHVKDDDGDIHLLVLKIIQKPDSDL
jgi:hypothetical protein